MRKLIPRGLLLAAVLFTTPAATFAQTSGSVQEEYRETLLRLIDALQQQIYLLQQQLSTQSEELVGRVETNPVGFSELVKEKASYRVYGADDTSKITDLEHRDYLQRIYELFPDKYDDKLRVFEVFTGDETEFDAFVETLPPTHETWMYATHEDLLDKPQSSINTELIVHELAHIVSYEPTGDGPISSFSDCHEYFDLHGCPAKDTFLVAFMTEFWTEVDLDRVEQFVNSGDAFEAAYDYYEDHKRSYVSDYATIGPEEDFAESFMYFILGRDAFGLEAEDKISFFSDYSEMIDIKEHVQKYE